MFKKYAAQRKFLTDCLGSACPKSVVLIDILKSNFNIQIPLVTQNFVFRFLLFVSVIHIHCFSSFLFLLFHSYASFIIYFPLSFYISLSFVFIVHFSCLSLPSPFPAITHYVLQPVRIQK